MLTDSEKQWIEQREAMQFLTGTYIADFEEYPLWNPGKDWQEAAEFESRVAATLADLYAELDFDYGCHDCPVWRPCSEFGHENCKFIILKYARLAVEEEMDG